MFRTLRINKVRELSRNAWQINKKNTPTEISDLDIQTAVIALRQGNARLMTNPLPGENKFGKRCAELKSDLIDFKLAA